MRYIRIFCTSVSKQRGAGVVEYSLLLGLLAAVVVTVIILFGVETKQLFASISNRLCNSIGLVNCQSDGTNNALGSSPAALLVTTNVTINQSAIPGECGNVTFTNQGTATITGLGTPIVSGQYHVGTCPPTTCATTLPASQSCQVSIQASGVVSGGLSGNVSLSSSNGGTAVAIVTGVAAVGGNLVGWGRNDDWTLGDNTQTSNQRATPVRGVNNVEFLSNVVQVVHGFETACARTAHGNAHCWGRNSAGQVGDGTTSIARPYPVTVVGVGGSGILSGVSALSGGEYTHCAIINSGQVVCWGSNTDGALGDNGTSARNYPNYVVGIGGSGNMTGASSISGGSFFTCALRSGTVACWGRGGHGQMGDGLQNNRLVPVNTTNQSGSGTLSGVTSLSAGGMHACVSRNGDVMCWGQNLSGQVGNNTTSNAVLTPQPVRGIGNIGTLSGISVVSSGDTHSCGLGGGNVYCWGDNGSGRLGDLTNTNRLVPIQVSGPSGVGLLAGATHISTSLENTCALAISNTYCWGSNSYLQLGRNGAPTFYPERVTESSPSGFLEGATALPSNSPRSFFVHATK